MELMKSALQLADRVARNSPSSLYASKAILKRGLDAELFGNGSAWDINEEYMQMVRESADSREGPRAFLEKRDPVWQEGRAKSLPSMDNPIGHGKEDYLGPRR
jgi:crotonobetainyl-CoA hydratase